MGEMAKLLEDVAQEVAQKVSEDDTFSTDSMSEVLKRRLLPLLEIGRALATPYGDGIDQLLDDYRAALAAAGKPVNKRVGYQNQEEIIRKAAEDGF